ncbi:MAG: Mu transposase C-terminal domain-containing protein [Sneathiellaceae bacterium]
MNGPLARQQWFTAEELAGLPGMPGTKRNVNRLVQRENWTYRERQGRGGGREYHSVWLPAAAKQALLERSLREAGIGSEVHAELPAPPPAPHLTEAEVQVRAARLQILLEIEARAGRRGLVKAEEAFIAAIAAGELTPELQQLVDVANARRKGLSRRTIRRWRRDSEIEGADALVPKDSAARRREASPPWLYAFMKRYSRPTKPSVRQVYEELQEELALPTLRTVHRAVANLGAIGRNRGRLGPRELKTLRAYTVRTTDELLPGDVYVPDGHCADFEVQHPQHGRAFRPEIVTFIDVKTRRVAGWSAGIAESAWLVTDALRRACCDSGIPAIVYSDRGAGFVNHLLCSTATGQLDRLGILQRYSLPYNSQARGVIERAHSLWIRAGRTLPAYVGRDMDREARQIAYKRGRRDIEETGKSRVLMPWEEFLAWAQAQVDAYNARPQGGLPRVRDRADGPLRHMTPDEAWQAHLEDGWAPVTPTEEEQIYLFRPHELRVVDRGQVRIHGHVYFSHELEAGDWHGRTVRVAYDIRDASRVWVKDEDGRFICTAEVGGNHAAFFPAPVIEQAREKRAAARLKRLEAHADEVRAEAGLQPPAAQVIQLTPEQESRHRELVERLTAPAQPAAQPQNREDGWYRDARRIEERIAAGEAVSDDDRDWLQQMQATPWFQAREAHRRRREALFGQEETPARAGSTEAGA